MDSLPKKNKQMPSNSSEISDESLNKYNQNNQENNDDEDKDTINLFKGIVKITRIKSVKDNKIPILKSNNLNKGKNISNLIDHLYNNEEHLNNNPIFPKNISENISPKNSVRSPKRSRPLKLLNISKGKNSSLIKKSIFKKNTNNFSSVILKKNEKGNTVNHKYGDITHKNSSKLHKNNSFFMKLKEKNKIPSKTPYLDKKDWYNSSNNLKKCISEEKSNENNINAINRISNKSFFETIKLKNNNINSKDNEEEKNNDMINSDKKLIISNGGVILNSIKAYKINNNINKSEIEKLETNKCNDKKQLGMSENKDEKKNGNNIIFFILIKNNYTILTV